LKAPRQKGNRSHKKLQDGTNTNLNESAGKVPPV